MPITSKEILGYQTSLSITFFSWGGSELTYNFISFLKLVFPNNVVCPLSFALDIYNAILNVKDETQKLIVISQGTNFSGITSTPGSDAKRKIRYMGFLHLIYSHSILDMILPCLSTFIVLFRAFSSVFQYSFNSAHKSYLLKL